MMNFAEPFELKAHPDIPHLNKISKRKIFLSFTFQMVDIAYVSLYDWVLIWQNVTVSK